MVTSNNNPYKSFLEEEPRTAFYGLLDQQGMLDSPGRQREAENIYQQAMQGFYGKLGSMALSEQAPTLQFSDYIQQNFPFTERFAQIGRGQSSRFSPRTRRLFY